MTSFKPTFDPAVGFEPAILDFWGVLKEARYEVVHNDNYNRDTQVVFFDFTDVEVLESKDPYNFPTFTARVNYNTTPDTAWDVLGKSFRSLAPDGVRDPDVLTGKRQHWKWDDCELRSQKDGVWGNWPAKSWRIVEVEGWAGADSGPTVMELVAELADGKTGNQFMQEYYQSDAIRNHSGYQQATEKLAKGVLLQELVDSGALTKDADGVHHKAG